LEHHPAAEYRVEVRGDAGQQVVRNIDASEGPGSVLFQDIVLRDTATLNAILEFASEAHEDSDWQVKYRRIEVGQGFNYPDAEDAPFRRREGAFVAENLTPGIYESVPKVRSTTRRPGSPTNSARARPRPSSFRSGGRVELTSRSSASTRRIPWTCRCRSGRSPSNAALDVKSRSSAESP
jgi:hypothetical protein